MRPLSVAPGSAGRSPTAPPNYVLIAEIKGTFDYEGMNYVFAGQTVEISVAVSGTFPGSQAAGGGSIDGVAH